MWNPWRGCKKCSDGCLYCYIHKGDAKRGVDTGIIEKTKDFAKPIEHLKNGILLFQSAQLLHRRMATGTRTARLFVALTSPISSVTTGS